MEINRNFLGGGEGCKTKNLWVEHRYFLELHIVCGAGTAHTV